MLNDTEIVCYVCGEPVPLEQSVVIRFTDSPKDKVGYPERVCQHCAETLDATVFHSGE